MQTVAARLREAGQLVIPPEYCQALGVRPGDEVILRLEGRDLCGRAPQPAIRRAQELVRKYVPEWHSLVDELLEGRRKESRVE